MILLEAQKCHGIENRAIGFKLINQILKDYFDYISNRLVKNNKLCF